MRLTIRFYKVRSWEWDTESKFAGWALTFYYVVIRVYVCTGSIHSSWYDRQIVESTVFSPLNIWMQRRIFSREIVPFRIREQMKPESVSVIVHFIVYIYIWPYSRKQVMGLHANGGRLDQSAWMPFMQLPYVDSYSVTIYIFSYSDHDSLNYWNGGQ